LYHPLSTTAQIEKWGVFEEVKIFTGMRTSH
jgi:hypothetical protein